MTAPSLLPEQSATPLEYAIEQSGLRAFQLPIDILRTLKNPATIPTEFLPYLASEWSANLWSDDWSEATRRAYTGAQFLIAKHAGSVGAVEDALGALNYGAVLREWFDTGSAAYTFRIEIDLFSRPFWNEAEYADIWLVALREKPVRAHLTEIRGTYSRDAIVRVATGTTLVVSVEWDAVDGQYLPSLDFSDPDNSGYMLLL